MDTEWWQDLASLLEQSFDEGWDARVCSLTSEEVQTAFQIRDKTEQGHVRLWLGTANDLRGRVGSIAEVSPTDRENAMIARLGLWFWFYFRAATCPLLWEDVAKLANKSGGYPAGGFLHKLAGDIYREECFERDQIAAEKQNCESKSNEKTSKEVGGGQAGGPQNRLDEAILVVAYTPMAVLPNEMNKPEIRDQDSDMDKIVKRIERLARQYAFLQMMLYLSKGYHISYVFSQLAAKREFEKRKQKFPLNNCLKHTERLFVHGPPAQRLIAFKDDVLLRNLPTSVLGSNRGVVSEGAISLPGPHVPAPCRLATEVVLRHRREQFQKTLTYAKDVQQFEVLTKENDKVRAKDWINV